MKKIRALIPFLVLLATSLSGQQLQWVDLFYGTYSNFNPHVAWGTDYHYFAASFDDLIDVDPGSGQVIYEPLTRDAFIGKYGDDGDLLWSTHLVGNDASSLLFRTLSGIVITPDGGVAACGNFLGQLSMGDLQLECPNDGDYLPDGYLVKYDAQGELVFGKHIIRGDGNVDVSALTVDQQGNYWIAGDFYQTADFDPGLGENLLSPPGSAIFLAKYNSNGDLIWARHFAVEGTPSVRDIITDEAGNTYIVGYFKDAINFSTPNSTVPSLAAAGSGNPYMAKFTSTGEVIWSKVLKAEGDGSLLNAQLTDLQVSEAGTVMAAGYFQGPSIQVGAPGEPGADIMNPYDIPQAFWVEYTSTGELVSSICLCTENRKDIRDFELIGNDQILITGTFRNSLNFPNSVTEVTAMGNGEDIYFTLYDREDETFEWAYRVGGIANDSPHDIYLDDEQQLYLAGGVAHIVDFDLTEKTFISEGTSILAEYFLAKYSFTDLISSTDVVEEFLSIDLYPNPAQNQLIIQNDQGEALWFEMVSPQGQRLKQGYLLNGTNTIDISALSAGVVWVRICAAKASPCTQSRKIVLIR